MDYRLEVLTLAVTDVDRAAAFYAENLGFVLDVDYHPTSDFRVVQLTPPGSACSIQIGVGLTEAPPGSARATYLAVTDIEILRQYLTERGVSVSAIRHKSPIQDWRGAWQPGPDPERRDYASRADFTDPDGNTWVIQEIGYHTSTPSTARNRRPELRDQGSGRTAARPPL
jgi:catechol 2,3-dioxygenase-like lactoylglutathione lyase family enzyme